MNSNCIPVENAVPEQFHTLPVDIQEVLLAQNATINREGCPADRCATCINNTGFGVAVADYFVSDKPIEETEIRMERALPELAGAFIQFCVAADLHPDDVRTLMEHPKAVRDVGVTIRSFLNSIESICGEEDYRYSSDNLLSLFLDTRYKNQRYYDQFRSRVNTEKIEEDVGVLSVMLDPFLIKEEIEKLEDTRAIDVLKTFYFDPYNGIAVKKVAKISDKVNADRHETTIHIATRIRKESAARVGDRVRGTVAKDSVPRLSEEAIDNMLNLDMSTFRNIFFRDVAIDTNRFGQVRDVLTNVEEFIQTVPKRHDARSVVKAFLEALLRLPGLQEALETKKLK